LNPTLSTLIRGDMYREDFILSNLKEKKKVMAYTVICNNS
jgi:hypothetical protein